MPNTGTMDLALSRRDAVYCAIGLRHYARRLETLKASTEKLHRVDDVVRYQAEIEDLTSRLVGPFLDGRSDHCRPEDLPLLREGLAITARNMRAAKGTLTPFVEVEGVVAVIETLERHATAIEEETLEKLQDQTALDLTTPEGRAEEPPDEPPHDDLTRQRRRRYSTEEDQCLTRHRSPRTVPSTWSRLRGGMGICGS